MRFPTVVEGIAMDDEDEAVLEAVEREFEVRLGLRELPREKPPRRPFTSGQRNWTRGWHRPRPDRWKPDGWTKSPEGESR